uniref:Ovule protein n=1 Tax=Heterorhabditis bacteriophora TaxID=37862 RepID=A0A1I7X392_HETBA
MVRNAMDKMIQIDLDHSHPISANENCHSLDELDNLLSSTTPEQNKAAMIAVAQRKLAATSSKQAPSPLQKGIRTTDLAISPILDDSMDVN